MRERTRHARSHVDHRATHSNAQITEEPAPRMFAAGAQDMEQFALHSR